MGLLQCQMSLAKQDDIMDIKSIWNEVFFDDFQYIERFLKFIDITKNCMILKENDNICSILFMLDCFCTIDGTSIPGSYIYAVATKKEKRGNGFMTMLEKKSIEYLKCQGKKFVSLVPQTKELFDMYSKIGYETCSYNSHYDLSDFIYNKSTTLTKCSTKEFLKLRKIYLNSFDSYIDFYDNFYDYRNEEMKVYKIKYNNLDYFLAGYFDKENFYIRETSLNLVGLKSALFEINKIHEIKKAVVRNNFNSQDKYGMVKFIDMNNNINNVYMNLMLD